VEYLEKNKINVSNNLNEWLYLREFLRYTFKLRCIDTPIS